jgi:hypothetical protein
MDVVTKHYLEYALLNGTWWERIITPDEY